MRQIAAEELDVALERVALLSGDTELTPNEGYTAGSQSIQFGGVALRLACAEVRALFLAEAAAMFGCSRPISRSEDGAVTRDGMPTGQDYWSLAAAVDLGRHASGRAMPKPARGYRVVGRSAPRVDLAAKVFGAPVFVHDMVLDGMLHARVVRQPRRGATIRTVDEAAIRRAAKGPVEIVRDGNFLAISGRRRNRCRSRRGGRGKPCGVGRRRRDQPVPGRGALAVAAALDRPGCRRPAIDPPRHRRQAATRRPTPACTSRTLRWRRLAAWPCFATDRLQVWTHSQGVYPLRAALARMLKLDPALISVSHVQGPGCYGHNGADDAAADAAVIAMRTPGIPVRVRWRREDEFGFEPVSPAMVVTARAALDAAGRPSDWTDRNLERAAFEPSGRRRQPARRRSAPRPAAGAARD